VLRSFSVEGYRSFPEYTRLDLAAITVLCGVNSVGKSSVIDLLAAVVQSRQELSGDVLRVRGSWVDLGPADKLAARERRDQRAIGVGWTTDLGTDVFATFEVGSDPGGLRRSTIDVEDPRLGTRGADGRHPFALCDTNRQEVDLLGVDVAYLGPYRAAPEALYAPRLSLLGPELGRDGRATAEALHRARVQQTDVGPSPLPLSAFVNAWWSDILGARLHARTGTVGRAGFTLEVDAPGMEGLGLGEVGLGLSQTLPVIVLAGLSRPGQVVAVQTPEAHLHPAAQHRLAALFVALARAGRQVILETHSEHLVNALRISVKRGEIAPENLAIHFFEQDEGGVTRVCPVEVSTEGRLSRWPAGFFDQGAIEFSVLAAP